MKTRIAVCLLAFTFFYQQIHCQTIQGDELVDLRVLIPTLVLDIRYATANNFTGKQLYPVARAKLRREPAESLLAVQDALVRFGLQMKIFDAYRPLSVQKKLWEIMPNEDFVANPANGSRHNRGAAVDLTLIDSTGKELPMPTPYDDFTPKAGQEYTDLPDTVIANRNFLKSMMMKHGFLPLKTEWWHFDFTGWERYTICDESLEN